MKTSELKQKLQAMALNTLGTKPSKKGTLRRSKRKTSVTLGRMQDRELAAKLKAMGFREL